MDGYLLVLTPGKFAVFLHCLKSINAFRTFGLQLLGDLKSMIIGGLIGLVSLQWAALPQLVPSFSCREMLSGNQLLVPKEVLMALLKQKKEVSHAGLNWFIMVITDLVQVQQMSS